MKEETKNQIWEKLEKFAEKRVRQEKKGYLQLLKIQQRSEEVFSRDKEGDIDGCILKEGEKGYSEEDLRFFWSNTASDWFSNVNLYMENKVTGVTEQVQETYFVNEELRKRPFHLRLQNMQADEQPKDQVLRAKELEKRFKEEEQVARQHLKHELEEKDNRIERLERENSQLRERVQELEAKLESETDEVEEEDA